MRDPRVSTLSVPRAHRPTPSPSLFFAPNFSLAALHRRFRGARQTLRASRFIYNYIYAHANHPGNSFFLFSTPANRHSELLRLCERKG